MIPTTTTTTLNSHVVRQDYQIKSNKKVDILIVDDNSGSMEYEQRSMAKRMSTFLNQLSGLDWRVAVTTTDPRSSAIWGDGRIVEMKGLPRQYFIDSSMDSDRAQKILGNTLQRPETGSPYEQGIYATYRAIERSFMTSKEKACSCTSSHASSTNYGKNSACRSPNQDFFRDDANFATIVISDEDESKKKEKNIPENLLKFVKSTWKDKNFAFHSIVTRPGDVACKKGHGASYGNIYARMSQLTGNGTVGGAIIGSVCETDYGSQLAGIGDSVQQMQRVIPLKCAPIGSSTSSVVVWLNGSNYTASYEVQGDRLVFSSRLPAGQYSLEYRCP
ncbi:MAG: hypothetical protein COT73_08700 [Bdellovibrio sp. CG10_big_fil_rev_8_21_14_0_10_47_8]|nr:MAG: hypothetical protein COT73_08700 [Bdellovibrio sp. CG10_big_fil_rev_8_21_14_0_10_47_8]